MRGDEAIKKGLLFPEQVKVEARRLAFVRCCYCHDKPGDQVHRHARSPGDGWRAAAGEADGARSRPSQGGRRAGRRWSRRAMLRLGHLTNGFHDPFHVTMGSPPVAVLRQPVCLASGDAVQDTGRMGPTSDRARAALPGVNGAHPGRGCGRRSATTSFLSSSETLPRCLHALPVPTVGKLSTMTAVQLT